MKKIKLEEHTPEILNELDLADYFGGSGTDFGSGSVSSGSGPEPMPSGVLSSNGQERVGTFFFRPVWCCVRGVHLPI